MKGFVSTLWAFLRAWSGDSAYDTYARRQKTLGRRPLSPREFYLDGLQRKYSGVTRCC